MGLIEFVDDSVELKSLLVAENYRSPNYKAVYCVNKQTKCMDPPKGQNGDQMDQFLSTFTNKSHRQNLKCAFETVQSQIDPLMLRRALMKVSR